MFASGLECGFKCCTHSILPVITARYPSQFLLRSAIDGHNIYTQKPNLVCDDGTVWENGGLVSLVPTAQSCTFFLSLTVRWLLQPH